MSILGSTGTGFRVRREMVAFEDIDLLEITRQSTGRRQTADTATNHDCAPTAEIFHDPLQRFRNEQIIMRRLQLSFGLRGNRYMCNMPTAHDKR